MQSTSLTVQFFLTKFPGQILIPLVEASQSIGISAKTARNKLSIGTFPIATVKIAGRRFIHIQDLVNYVDSLRFVNVTPEQTVKRPVGRPTKSSQLKNMRGVL